MNGLWILNIFYKIGLGNIWENPNLYDKSFIKSSVNNRLESNFIQKYNEYISKPENSDKCYIINNCKTDVQVYKIQPYLGEVKNHEIRSRITKLRIDINCTMDSKNRNFRYKNIQTSNCIFCKTKQDVNHVLFECKKPEIILNRNIFQDKCKIYSKNYDQKCNITKMREILCMQQNCNQNIKELICTFIQS